MKSSGDVPRDNRALQRAIFNSANFLSIATDAAGVIRIFNVGAERMLGYTSAEVVNKITLTDLSDPEELLSRTQLLSEESGAAISPGFATLVFKAARGIEDTSELTYIRKDGTRLPAVVSVTALRGDTEAAIIGYLLIGTDNTARKQFETDLRQARADAERANQTKSDFLASMSHEMRTPVHAMVGIADLLLKTQLSEKQRKYVEILSGASDNLLDLINDILDLSKVEASQLDLERTEFSLADLLESITQMLGVQAQQKGLILGYEIAGDIPDDLMGDPMRLRQVLLNLIGNAIKFTEAGEVRLRVTTELVGLTPGLLRFAVTDTGIGIAEAKLVKIFERFTQADSSTPRRYGGSGLGLAISRRLVELMGGEIGVTSIETRGSEFYFTLPLQVAAQRAPKSAGYAGVQPEQPLGPLKILLVEDFLDNRTITEAYLRDTPYQIEIAENGVQAFEKFRAGNFDLVLMDSHMPVMDGLTATRIIRKWEHDNNRQPTPIIALTAAALKGDREKCLAAGYTSYLTKPIKQPALLQAIRACSSAAS